MCACVRVCSSSLFRNLILDIEELSGNSSMESKYREHRTTNSILSNARFNEIMNNPSVDTSARGAQTDEFCLYAPTLELSILTSQLGISQDHLAKNCSAWRRAGPRDGFAWYQMISWLGTCLGTHPKIHRPVLHISYSAVW